MATKKIRWTSKIVSRNRGDRPSYGEILVAEKPRKHPKRKNPKPPEDG